MSGTVSDVFGSAESRHGARSVRNALVVIVNGDDPAMTPSRHDLDGIDVVCFKRGPRGVIRDRVDGLSRLVVRIPDPLMSTEHGRLLCTKGRWMLDDPDSKNGAVIGGAPSRCGMIEPGSLFELGHTIFVLDTVETSATDAPDVELDTTSPLASLHPELVSGHDALGLIARSDVPILLIGKTGTGKEVYAQAIHAASGRPGPIVAVNCGALSASLLEAELFGHRRGAFSGATSDRAGFVRSAHRGTLFLDEIGELSPAAQVALLRVLQEREVTPVGDSQPVSVDIRVCAAAQRPLQLDVDAGRFRADLYARLLGYELRLPSLHDRWFDIGALIGRILARLAPHRRITIAPAAARALLSYEWPLNIRELERALATALVLACDQPIELAHLPEVVQHAKIGRVGVDPETTSSDVPAPADHTDVLREQLAALLAQHRGNVSAVARELGKHREQVHRWMRRFGFDPDAFRH